MTNNSNQSNLPNGFVNNAIAQPFLNINKIYYISKCLTAKKIDKKEPKNQLYI